MRDNDIAAVAVGDEVLRSSLNLGANVPPLSERFTHDCIKDVNLVGDKVISVLQ